MTDTIELLEEIGRNASLRHAPAGDLTILLDKANASEALRAAMATGQRERLADELGYKPMQTPQITQAPAREEEPAPDDGEGDDQNPLPTSRRTSSFGRP